MFVTYFTKRGEKRSLMRGIAIGMHCSAPAGNEVKQAGGAQKNFRDK
jgi:hypothetical protein